MQKLDSGLEISPDYVIENGLQDKMVMRLDGLKLDLNQLVGASTGDDGFVTFTDWPEPKIENDEIVSYVKSGNVEAYIID